MCSVMAGIGAALSLFSGYANYESQKSAIQAQADSQASYLRAQAQADEANAQARERNAQVEARKQEQIADNYGNEQRKLRDRQRIAAASLRAGAGAAGLDSSTGSPFDIQSAGQEAYWQDQMTLLGNQRNDNFASRVTQSNYINEAGQLRNQAENNRRQAQATLDDADRQIGALGLTSILGTATSMVPFLSGIGGGGSTGNRTNFGTVSANAGHGYSWNYNTATGASNITGGWKLGQSNYRNGFSLGGW